MPAPRAALVMVVRSLLARRMSAVGWSHPLSLIRSGGFGQTIAAAEPKSSVESGVSRRRMRALSIPRNHALRVSAGRVRLRLQAGGAGRAGARVGLATKGDGAFVLPFRLPNAPRDGDVMM